MSSNNLQEVRPLGREKTSSTYGQKRSNNVSSSDMTAGTSKGNPNSSRGNGGTLATQGSSNITSTPLGSTSKIIKKKVVSPKSGTLNLDSKQSSYQTSGGGGGTHYGTKKHSGASLTGAGQQPNYLNAKTRTKTSSQMYAAGNVSGNIGASDSLSSGGGGQPAMQPSSLPRKMYANAPSTTKTSTYKTVQTYSSQSPKGNDTLNISNKHLFQGSSSQQQFFANTKGRTSAGAHDTSNSKLDTSQLNGQQAKYGGVKTASRTRNVNSSGSAAAMHAATTGHGVGLAAQKKSLPGQTAASNEYYSRNSRQKQASPESNSMQHTMQQHALTAAAGPSKIKKTAGNGGFMKRRVSDEKKDKSPSPNVFTQKQALLFQEYISQKSRSPQNVSTKQMEIGMNSTGSAQMFTQGSGSNSQIKLQNGGSMQQLRIQQKPRQQPSPLQNAVFTSSQSKMSPINSAQAAAQKSRNFAGDTKYKTLAAQGAIVRGNSPKGTTLQQSSGQTTGMKMSSKQTSPTYKPAVKSVGGNNNQIFEYGKTGTKKTKSGSISQTQAQKEAATQQIATGQKKVVQKLMPKQPPNVQDPAPLDDFDDEEDYEDEDFDEENTRNIAKKPQATLQKQITQQPSSQKTISSLQKRQQRELLRNIWMSTEKDDMMSCMQILKSQEPFLAQALLNQCNSDGWTPLHVASNEGHVDLIELFVEFGGILDARSKNFRTPLHVACIRGNLGVIQALLMAGADINAKDIDGNTPCHFCSEYGHKDCLRWLLLKHPSLFSKNKEGLSPLDVAVNTEILQTFQDYIQSVKNILQTQKTTSGKGSTSKSSSGSGAVAGSSQQSSATSQPKAKTSSQMKSSKSSQEKEEPKNVKLAAITKQGSRQQLTTTQHSSHKSGEGGNTSQSSVSSGQQQRMLQVDQKTLKQRAKNKQIQIFDSVTQQNRESLLVQSSVENEIADNMVFQGSVVEHDISEEPNVAAVQQKVGPAEFMPLRLLGSGSFGEVYLVREVNSDELYAMKVLSKQRILGQNLVRYAKTERDVLSYTKHPFIVSLNSAFQTRTKLFLILDFCPGGDLGRILQKEGRFTESRARNYLCEVLLALEDLHKRDIIYRDLKPDNVVLDDHGHALLTDFGLSKEGVFEGNKGAKSFCGSVAYLAPEMLRKAGHGKSVDWYLLGVLLYEMIVGQPPYFSDSKSELFNNIQRGVLKLPVSMSPEAKNLIVHLLNRNPSRRLGAGSEGSSEIKRHPFFQSIDWDMVINRGLEVPKPKATVAQYKEQYYNVSCTEEQKRRIFEDFDDQLDAEANNNNKRVEGWSFVNVDQNLQKAQQQKMEKMLKR